MCLRSNLLAALVALLPACATVTPPPDRLIPPVDLIQDCPEPPSALKTNGALAIYIDDLKNALRGCNRDKKALREWAESE